MGSTIYTNVKFLALESRSSSGEACYVYYEETYESNVHPIYPTWCALAAGSLQNCLSRVILNAGIVEGGMFTNPRRSATPESYLARCDRALKTVYLYRGTINFQFTENCIHPALKPAIETVMKKHGFACKGDTWSFEQHPRLSDALIELFSKPCSAIAQDGTKVSLIPYRLFPSSEGRSNTLHPDPNVSVKLGKRNVSEPSAFQCLKFNNTDENIVLFMDGVEHSIEWPYAHVNNYACTIAGYECITLKDASQLISNFRDTLDKAAPIPDNAFFVVSKSSEMNERLERDWKSLCNTYDQPDTTPQFNVPAMCFISDYDLKRHKQRKLVVPDFSFRDSNSNLQSDLF